MNRIRLIFFVLFLAFCVFGCTTAASRNADRRLSELETRIHRLEAGPKFADKEIPLIPENIETITPEEMNFPVRKMPKLK